MWILTLVITIRPNDLEIPWYALFFQQQPCRFTFLHSILLYYMCIFSCRSSDSFKSSSKAIVKLLSWSVLLVCCLAPDSLPWASEKFIQHKIVMWQFIAVFTYPTKSFLCISRKVQICSFIFRELYLVCWCNVTVTALIHGKEITCPTYLA